MAYKNSWREHEIKARSKQVDELVFLDSSPNHFYIRNFGDSPVYVAMKSAPTEKYYDIVVPASGTKTMARAAACSRIYFLNTSTTDARLQITSYYKDEVDANFLVAGASTTSAAPSGGSGGGSFGGIISGFEVPLPVGGNHIGGVNIDNTTSNPVPTTLQGEAMTYLLAIKNDIAAIEAVQTELQSMVSAIKQTAADLLAANSSAIGGAYLSGVTSVGETNGTTHNQAGKYISYFSNDGANTIKLALYNTSGNQMMVIDILAGEALSDIPIKFSKFKLWSEGTACSYRALILAE